MATFTQEGEQRFTTVLHAGTWCTHLGVGDGIGDEADSNTAGTFSDIATRETASLSTPTTRTIKASATFSTWSGPDTITEVGAFTAITGGLLIVREKLADPDDVDVGSSITYSFTIAMT